MGFFRKIVVMKARLLFILSIFPLALSARQDAIVANPYATYFDRAYQEYPSVPRGVLEAVAFTNTHFNHITHNPGEHGSCIGMPEAFGVMGLVADGKSYFRNNLSLVSEISGYSVDDIINDPEKNILAYAATYALISTEFHFSPDVRLDDIRTIASTLKAMSELPAETEGQQFARETQLYGIFSFMNNATYQQLYNFPDPQFDLPAYFGDNYAVLSAPRVTVTDVDVRDENGNVFRAGGNDPEIQSADYGPALWVAACNWSSRNSVAISAVTIHDVEGSYSGCISWFQNCNSGVSAHYVVRSSDGQITQMVLEANKAWHVGSENPYTVGIEHEGYASQTGWYTVAMYTSSAALVADICADNSIDPLRTAWWPWSNTTYYNTSSMPGGCTRVKGHQHYPNQTHTDPGPNWDWDYFYKLVNPAPAATIYTAASGNIYDSGGAGGNYLDDERYVWTIAPTGATSVTLTFNSFSTESSWDYLFIYDGADVNAPLIGQFTGTTSPGVIVSTGGELTVEFRSDCATDAPGWDASWTSNTTVIVPANLSVTALGCPNLGVTLNWANSGAGWYVDISEDPNFTTYYNKDVSNLTSVGCPGSFCDYPACTSYLKFRPNTTYYWRIWDGTSHTMGSSFTTPDCQYADYNCTGTFDDTGGPSSAHTGNEDYTYMIMPVNASTVTISFTSFDLETDYDSLYIFDGPSIASPLIGGYTGTNSPGNITSTGGALTLRFISDPFVNNAGFTSTWSCTQVTTDVAESDAAFSLNVFPNPFSDQLHVSYELNANADVTLSLTDVLGREIVLSKKTEQVAGSYTQEMNVAQLDLAKGVYFLQLTVDGESSVVKIVRE